LFHAAESKTVKRGAGEKISCKWRISELINCDNFNLECELVISFDCGERFRKIIL
jgi:hypothetical protein